MVLEDVDIVWFLDVVPVPPVVVVAVVEAMVVETVAVEVVDVGVVNEVVVVDAELLVVRADGLVVEKDDWVITDVKEEVDEVVDSVIASEIVLGPAMLEVVAMDDRLATPDPIVTRNITNTTTMGAAEIAAGLPPAILRTSHLPPHGPIESREVSPESKTPSRPKSKRPPTGGRAGKVHRRRERRQRRMR